MRYIIVSVPTSLNKPEGSYYSYVAIPYCYWQLPCVLLRVVGGMKKIWSLKGFRWSKVVQYLWHTFILVIIRLWVWAGVQLRNFKIASKWIQKRLKSWQNVHPEWNIANVTIAMWLSSWIQNSAVLSSAWHKVSPGFASFLSKKIYTRNHFMIPFISLVS